MNRGDAEVAQGTRVITLILVVAGAGITMVYAYLAAYFVLDVSIRTVEYAGPGVALLGYLCALVGASHMPRQPDGQTTTPCRIIHL